MKKKTKIVAGIVGLFAAATLAMFGISGDTVIEMGYEINTQENVSTMSVYPPEELSVDIVELYCNNNFVTRALLPNGKLTSIPFVFTNLSNLEIRLFKLTECVGIGNFKDEKLYVAIKDSLLPFDMSDSQEEIDNEE